MLIFCFIYVFLVDFSHIFLSLLSFTDLGDEYDSKYFFLSMDYDIKYFGDEHVNLLFYTGILYFFFVILPLSIFLKTL